MERTAGRQGRPKGKDFSFAVRAYENQEGVRLLGRLAELRGLSVAALLRQLVREEAERKGLNRQDWLAAAERMKQYYETSPEVKEWSEVEDGYLEYAPADGDGLERR